MRTILTSCFLFTALLAVACTADAAEETKPSLAEVKKSIDKKQGVLIDVREIEEWEQGHLEGALQLPLSHLQAGAAKDAGSVLKSLPKDKIIYTHCAFGSRAATAAKLLEKRGYKVQALKPGYQELIAAGFPKAK